MGGFKIPVVTGYISIHSLRMEGDLLPHPLYRRSHGISIHSLRMEGDNTCSSHRRTSAYFNPLPPYGGRRLD